MPFFITVLEVYGSRKPLRHNRNEKAQANDKNFGQIEM